MDRAQSHHSGVNRGSRTVYEYIPPALAKVMDFHCYRSRKSESLFSISCIGNRECLHEVCCLGTDQACYSRLLDPTIKLQRSWKHRLVISCNPVHGYVKYDLSATATCQPQLWSESLVLQPYDEGVHDFCKALPFDCRGSVEIDRNAGDTGRAMMVNVRNEPVDGIVHDEPTDLFNVIDNYSASIAIVPSDYGFSISICHGTKCCQASTKYLSAEDVTDLPVVVEDEWNVFEGDEVLSLSLV